MISRPLRVTALTTVAAFAFSAALAGCGKRPTGPPRFETRGVVTHRGTPVPKAQVVFFSPGLGVSRGAITDDAGEFRVVAASGAGLPAGDYVVVVRPAPGGDEEMIDYNRPDIPAAHRSKQTSELRATVEDGENRFDFELAD